MKDRYRSEYFNSRRQPKMATTKPNLKRYLNIVLCFFVVIPLTASAERYYGRLSRNSKRTSVQRNPLVLIIENIVDRHAHQSRVYRNNLDDRNYDTNRNYNERTDLADRNSYSNSNNQDRTLQYTGRNDYSQSNVRYNYGKNRDHNRNYYKNDRNNDKRNYKSNRYFQNNERYNRLSDDLPALSDNYRSNNRHSRYSDRYEKNSDRLNTINDRNFRYEDENNYRNNNDRNYNDINNKFRNENRYGTLSRNYVFQDRNAINGNRNDRDRYRSIGNNFADRNYRNDFVDRYDSNNRNDRNDRIDENTNRIFDKNYELPLNRNLLRASGNRNSCEDDGDSCEETTTPKEVVTDDPCDPENSCGEEDNDNISTRGIPSDYVSEMPPNCC